MILISKVLKISLKSSIISSSFVSDMLGEDFIVLSKIDTVILINMMKNQKVKQCVQDCQTHSTEYFSQKFEDSFLHLPSYVH